MRRHDPHQLPDCREHDRAPASGSRFAVVPQWRPCVRWVVRGDGDDGIERLNSQYQPAAVAELALCPVMLPVVKYMAVIDLL